MKKIILGLIVLVLVGCNEDKIKKVESKIKKLEKKDKKAAQLTDKRDGKTYKTVKIGTQEWMAENLAYKPSSGNYWEVQSSILSDLLDEVLKNQIEELKYGYLYDWETAKKVCPVGWHLPSDDEWTTLTDYLGGENVAGTKMKSTSGWNYDGNGTNESGFSGLPGGARSLDGYYYGIGSYGSWWSSTQSNASTAWYHSTIYSNGFVYRYNFSKGSGFSVRCLRD